MFPTIERRPSRSTYSSVRTLPSWTATRVSTRPALTTMCFPTRDLDPGPEARAAIPALTSVELPHSDREEKPQRHERHHHRGSAVAHERQRNPDDGQQARHHPQV